MTTATITADAAIPARAGGAMLRRFVWKEYRMLRGLWLAVAVLGGLVQWLLDAMMPPSANDAATLFATALAAAALYAVGAAATTFSVEHEEETHDFLAGLPATWWPAFAGKLLVAAVSAIALAGLLTLTGWLICGERPNADDTSVALGMLGFAIVECLAWGTLFSLLVKRPLAAAILALVVGAVAVNTAVNSTTTYAVGSTVPRAYGEAIPARLAIVGVVLACSVAAGRRWLTTDSRRIQSATSRGNRLFGIRQKLRAILGFRASAASRGARTSMLARLIWQTWRESWKLLLLPVGVAVLLGLTVAALHGLENPGDDIVVITIISTLLFIPALYGAMAFSADQRRASYRFLAEHAAAPRYVWLARHVVWLGALLVLSVAVALVAAVWTTWAMRQNTTQLLDVYAHYEGQFGGSEEWIHNIASASSHALRGVALALYGILAAYALGQVCSMLMRSEILAAFVAIVLSTVLSGWISLLFVWRLSGWLFLLPLAIGLLLATWLRAPHWIAGRNGWRAWFGPVLAAVASLAIIGLTLPSVRLAQVPTRVYIGERRNQASVSVELAAPLATFRAGDTPAARKTADMYIQAAENLAAGPRQNLLARWERPGQPWTPGGFLEETIPAEDWEEFKAAERKQLALIRASRAEALAAVIHISKRPTCRFEFDASMIASVTTPTWLRDLNRKSYPLYEKLTSLLNILLAAPQVERRLSEDLDAPMPAEQHTPLERYMAALRISAHLRAGQPSAILIVQLGLEQHILRQLGQWASSPVRTEQELRDAREQLNAYFLGSLPDLQDALVADHLLVRRPLEGKDLPLALSIWPDSTFVYLAYLANELPWERERALRALNLVTLKNTWDAEQFAGYVAKTNQSDIGNLYLRRWLRPIFHWHDSLPTWELRDPAAATSYLMQFEYEARTQLHQLYRAYADNQVCRRAALLQIGLAAYRLDHGKYPKQLADLVPKYLDSLPLDPYSRQPFQYEPKGLDLPLEPSYAANFGRLEPNTPFLWSVGSANVRLQRRAYEQLIGGENVSIDERPTATVDFYVLASHEPSWWNDPKLVFPLSK